MRWARPTYRGFVVKERYLLARGGFTFELRGRSGGGQIEVVAAAPFPPWPAETRMTSPLPPNALRFRPSSRARSRLRWVVLGLAVALVFDVLVAPWLASSATDWLWFREIHFESVFVTSLVAHTVLFVVAALVAYGFLYANLSVARRSIASTDSPVGV